MNGNYITKIKLDRQKSNINDSGKEILAKEIYCIFQKEFISKINKVNQTKKKKDFALIQFQEFLQNSLGLNSLVKL